MGGRVRRKALAAIPPVKPPRSCCALCDRPLGTNVEWHHPVPKSEGGRATVPLHPICHRAIHAAFGNSYLARIGADLAVLRDRPELAPFLRWIAGKPPDFRAPTHSGRKH